MSVERQPLTGSIYIIATALTFFSVALDFCKTHSLGLSVVVFVLIGFAAVYVCSSIYRDRVA